MLAPVHHYGAQRGMHLTAVGEVDGREGFQAVQALGDADRQPGAAQQPGEGEQIRCEGAAAGALEPGRGGPRGADIAHPVLTLGSPLLPC